MGGGVAGMLLSYVVNKRKYIVFDMVNSVLSSLVSVTASCAAIRPWEAIIIGAVGAMLTLACGPIMNFLKIDDPVGAFVVHGIGGVWGMIAVGLFVDIDTIEDVTRGRAGLFHGGGFYLLGVQLLAIVAIFAWSGITSFITLWIIRRAIGLRMSEHDEKLGADFIEHGIDKDRILTENSIAIMEYLERRNTACETNELPNVSRLVLRRSSFGVRANISLNGHLNSAFDEAEEINQTNNCEVDHQANGVV